VHAQRLQVHQLVPDARREVRQRVVARVQLHQRSEAPTDQSELDKKREMVGWLFIPTCIWRWCRAEP
jgi:hypothetical protein